jgi:hypothetical protein
MMLERRYRRTSGDANVAAFADALETFLTRFGSRDLSGYVKPLQEQGDKLAPRPMSLAKCHVLLRFNSQLEYANLCALTLSSCTHTR